MPPEATEPTALDKAAPVRLDDLLEPFASRGIDLGLDRLRAALAEAGHPEQRFLAVQVAGTNGKGSICTLLHAILSAAGLRVGTYRSPHLISWCERIQLGNNWITPDQLRQDLAGWQERGRRQGLTPFELLTAACFERFAREDLDLAVLEVGLGGRLDATTAHPRRPVVGFASIGLDHREHLGDTIAAIAAEKAAVMSRDCIAISAPQHPEAAAVLEATAVQLGATLRWVPPLPTVSEGGPRLGLAGEVQRFNGAVAVGMVEALQELGWAIPAAAISSGLATAHWPGRLALHHWRGQAILLDGAHNPPAASMLRQELNHRDGSIPRRWLLGIQRHKQAPEMLETLLLDADQALITPIPGHPSWDTVALGNRLPHLAHRLQAVSDPLVGLELLVAPPAGVGSTGPWGCGDPGRSPHPVVAGSLYLLGILLSRLDPERG